MYIRLQAYVYIYWYIYIYIYTLAESRYALSYTLVTQTMLALPPTGVPFTFIFSFFFKNPQTKLKSFRISRPSRNMLQNDGDFTRTEKGSPSHIDEWCKWSEEIDEGVRGQNALARMGAAFAAVQSGFSPQLMVPRLPLHEVLAHGNKNI